MKGIGMNKFSGISLAVAVLAATTLAGCPKPAKTADLNTQNFAAGAAATTLGGKQLYYSPDGSISFYSRTVSTITGLGTATDTATAIDFSVADPFVLNLAAGSEVVYYGVAYDTLYIGSDGTVSFGAAGTGNASLTAHFQANQISLLPVDANDGTTDGTVSFQVFSDAVVVTFEDVDGSTFQSEFFISGDMDEDLAISYPTVNANASGIVGLSRGQLAGANQAEIDDFLDSFKPSDLGTNNTKSAKLGF